MYGNYSIKDMELNGVKLLKKNYNVNWCNIDFIQTGKMRMHIIIPKGTNKK